MGSFEAKYHHQKKKKMAPVTCKVLISGPLKTTSSAVGEAQPLHKAAVPRERKKVEAVTGHSVAAVLSPLCLHVFAHALPLARSSVSNLLSSLLSQPLFVDQDYAWATSS